MSDDFSSRPAAKRMRSDRDHSKGHTKTRENERNGGEDQLGSGVQEYRNGDDESEKDDDWLQNPPFSQGKSWDGWTTMWRESCWCGNTAFVFNSDPLQNKICHCEDCQRLHGAPFQHAAIFKKDSVRLDTSPDWLGFMSAHGEVHPLSHTPTPIPRKTSCRACGSPLFDEGQNMVMAFPPCFEFARSESEMDKFHNDTKGNSHNEHSHGRGEEGGRKVGLPDAFRPGCHIFYERRVLDVPDGLDKWRGHKGKSEKMGETERP